MQDLPPGTRLGEEMLVEVFDLGRRHVSAALQQLAWEGWLCIGRTAAPALRLLTRRKPERSSPPGHAIESGIVEALARAKPQPDFSEVETALKEERAERASGRLREAIRLSGGFHVHLARLSGNRILAEQVELLVARTSLVVALYENPGALTCWHDDHGALVRLIQARKPRIAVALMQRHLQELLDGIDLTRLAPNDFDAREVFKPK